MSAATAAPVDVATDLRRAIEAAIINAPRSRQATIGPSELGMECERCLTHRLAGTKRREEAAWLPFIGTAVHASLEEILTGQEQVRSSLGLPPRYLIEQRVTVGAINGIPITGSTDVFDIETGTVIDWKIVGTTTLRSAKASGPSRVYQTQASLYGIGWQAAGYTVNQVAIYYLPRNAINLSDGYAWIAPHDPAPGLAALQRADLILRSIASRGLDAALEESGEHTNDGFTCRTYPDWQPVTPQAPGGDPFAR